MALDMHINGGGGICGNSGILLLFQHKHVMLQKLVFLLLLLLTIRIDSSI